MSAQTLATWKSLWSARPSDTEKTIQRLQDPTGGEESVLLCLTAHILEMHCSGRKGRPSVAVQREGL